MWAQSQSKSIVRHVFICEISISWNMALLLQLALAFFHRSTIKWPWNHSTLIDEIQNRQFEYLWFCLTFWRRSRRLDWFHFAWTAHLILLAIRHRQCSFNCQKKTLGEVWCSNKGDRLINRCQSKWWIVEWFDKCCRFCIGKNTRSVTLRSILRFYSVIEWFCHGQSSEGETW